MFNIIVGTLFLIGGLSRKFALIGFNSPDLLAAIGAVMIAWGISQVRRDRRARTERRTDMDDVDQ